MADMTFKEFCRQRKRMCSTYFPCIDCPLYILDNVSCAVACVKESDKAESIVQKWAQEHPEVTNPSDNKTIEEKQAKTYEQGLEDAWELAIKIWCHIDVEELYKIFGTYEADEAMNGFTPKEAMQKLKEWEDKQIKVGDVLQFANHDKFVVVTSVDEDGMNYLCDNLGSYRSTGKEGDLFIKTDRNVADKLNALLDEIGGKQDGEV